MLVRLVDGCSGIDVVVSVHDPSATVAQLIAALVPSWRGRSLFIDGREVRAGQPLDRAGIGDGAEICLDRSDTRPPPPPPGYERLYIAGRGNGLSAEPETSAVAQLLVVDGADTAHRFALAPGHHLLGRPYDRSTGGDDVPMCAVHDPTVSRRHLEVVVGPDGTIQIADVGSTNGTTLAGRGAGPNPVLVQPGAILACGAARLLGAPIPRFDRRPGEPAGAGSGDAPMPRPARGAQTVPLHRRPRPGQAEGDAPIALPASPPPAPAVTPVGILAVAASVILGAVLVILLHSWTYAVFAILGPVLMVANAVDSRRRRRRVRRSSARQRRRDLETLDTELAARHSAERTRRRRLHPGAGAAVAQVRAAPTTCWQRRNNDGDAFAVGLGHGTVAWDPPVAGGPLPRPDDVAAVVDRHRRLDDAAVGCRLDPVMPLAIVGPRPAALALARAVLVQVAVDHGPADLRVALLTATDHAGEWDWSAWLPHARDPGGELLLAAGPVAGEPVVAALVGRDRSDEEVSSLPRPRTVVVMDDAAQLAARRSPVRSVLRAAADPAADLAPIVLVEHHDDVPALCRQIVTVTAEGGLDATPDITAGPATFTGVSSIVAAEIARRLARFDDPDRDDADRNLPATIALGDIAGFDLASPRAVAARWRAAGDDPAIHATIGAAEDGPLVVDLAADGPHALVAGTTGSGKSELLRTLVGSLALGASPDHLTFVLIDFKGGSAFDACEGLPHVTGVVTDLDDHLAARALRCLEAELRYRERRLREVGAEDLTAWRRSVPPDHQPLPRLVVVIDEFATLAAELGDFVDALVGVAQRGRSLGVHLVLATQRPSGSVSDHIRANTNLRIALRVQDATDSRDVIDRPDAASLPRSRPGRAVARLGPSELVAFQTAQVTAPLGAGQDTGGGRVPVTVAPLGINRDPAVRPASVALGTAPGGGPSTTPARTKGALPDRLAAERPPTELQLLVDATVAAWRITGGRAPRPAWPRPLPTSVDASDAALVAQSTNGETDLVIGLGDDPDNQRHVPFAWRLDDGPLLAVGLAGSGTTTLAVTAVSAAAQRWTSAELHVHAIDLGSGGLGRIEALPPVGAVLGAGDEERQRRLVSGLVADLAHRQAHGRGRRPRRMLVVDGLGAFRARWDDVEPSGTWAGLIDLLAHGTSVGIHVLLTADGSGPVPHHVLGACRQRLLFRLADRSDHAAYGVPAHEVPDLVPGRAVAGEGAVVVQIARPLLPDAAPTGSTTDAVSTGTVRLQVQRVPTVPWSEADPNTDGQRQCPSTVPVLPDEVALGSLRTPWVEIEPDGSVSLAIGVDDATLDVARLVLAPGGHALVAGPPRSGRTTALRTLAAVAASTDLSVVVLTARPRCWLSASGLTVLSADDADLARHLEPLADAGPLLVIVDDADRTDDEHPVLAALAHSRRPDRHLIAAGRVDRLRGRYGHWSRELQADRTGLLLQPDPDLDGDLLGVRLPRRLGPARPGRGWLTGDGPGGLVQVATPDNKNAESLDTKLHEI